MCSKGAKKPKKNHHRVLNFRNGGSNGRIDQKFKHMLGGAASIDNPWNISWQWCSAVAEENTIGGYEGWLPPGREMVPAPELLRRSSPLPIRGRPQVLTNDMELRRISEMQRWAETTCLTTSLLCLNGLGYVELAIHGVATGDQDTQLILKGSRKEFTHSGFVRYKSLFARHFLFTPSTPAAPRRFLHRTSGPQLRDLVGSLRL